jgi:lysophospholipase L1-like esterase
VLDGQLAWRQHDGGHTDGPNWRYFIPWADRFFKRPYTGGGVLVRTAAAEAPVAVVAPVPQVSAVAADQPVSRTDANSLLAHEQLLEKAKKGGIDIYFEGDSITRRWGATDYPEFLANWKQNFYGWNAADFGWGADTTQNILWRLNHGELDGVNPKVIVLLAGTNNVGSGAGAEDVTRGLEATVRVMQAKAPDAVVVVTGIFPRNDKMTAMAVIDQINANLGRLADGKRVRYLNVNDRLADPDGKLFEGMMGDGLHPTVKGYQAWADALRPIFREVLGSPANVDHAPAATGDPKAGR